MVRKLLTLALVASLLIAIWVWRNPIGMFGYHCFGFTVYSAVPFPYFDLRIHANGLPVVRAKSHFVSLEEARALLDEEPDVLIIGIGYDEMVKVDERILNTNGFINPEPLRELCQCVDAIRVDLKAFDEEFYIKVSQGRLEPVLETLKIIQEEGIHLEIINLVVPTLNDDPEEIRQMCQWIKENLGPDVPLHFSRFFPMYRLQNLPPTPVETLEKAQKIALEEGLHYVYIGNVPGHRAEDTYCPKCGKLLIDRTSFFVTENHIVDEKCEYCGEPIPGVWK